MDLGGLKQKFYSKVTETIAKNPEKKEDHKITFLTSTQLLIAQLIEEQKYEEIFKIFETSQRLYPSDSDVLNILGATLNRLEKPLESLTYLKQAYQLSPEKLKVYENYENVINQWVQRWHFSMLNDEHRNSCYRRAIKESIKTGNERVLDIGTGTGLLALYALEAGAKEVYACEEDEVMLDICGKVFAENNVNVTIIADHSTNISLEELNIPKFDVIVMEIFDSGAFGEGVLATLIHAKENLLKEGGVFVPNGIELFLTGVTSIGLEDNLNHLESTLENSIYLKNTILIPEIEGPYEPYEPIQHKVEMVTEPVSVFKVDFNDLFDLNDAIRGNLDKIVKLTCTEDETLEGFMVYFNLHLGKDILTNFDPGLPYNDKKMLEQCWDPVIFPLNSPMDILKYKILNAHLSCKEGILKLTHQYNNCDLRSLKIDQKVFQFLIDDELLCELDYNVTKALKNRANVQNFGDFMPFPHIGINLLKENKIRKLYCSSNLKTLVETIAIWNCIDRTSIEFIDDLEDLTKTSIKFEVVLLQPITSHSTINEDQLKYYSVLKENHLTTNGVLFPYKVELWGKLINSKWLDRVSHVQTVDGGKYGLEKHINVYSTKNQFDFADRGFQEISEKQFFISDVHFDEDLYKLDVSVPLKSDSCERRINGILQSFRIYFMENSVPITTDRKSSFCNLNCFVEDFRVGEGVEKVLVKFIQNEFTFRCGIDG